ncbi:uncharacterized protein N7506_007082 [Penicillium brevicompactum]|uniref:uncharacterized protein n=1 Tax=Penicillium brevicompactum TaxID=5074 RepID=UPI002541314C|nr:uncharacterized protein N7506_007082 [Penicillium brevicompactum]KAJ5333299.1 hypothetical protein N7506_007082 [Penicillium brevicompactum]
MGESNRGSPSKQLLAFSPLAVGGARNEGPPPLAGVESRRRRVQLDPFAGWNLPAVPGAMQSASDTDTKPVQGIAQPTPTSDQSSSASTRPISRTSQPFQAMAQLNLAGQANPLGTISEDSPAVLPPLPPLRDMSQHWHSQPGAWTQNTPSDETGHQRLTPFSSLGLQSAAASARNIIAASQFPRAVNNNLIGNHSRLQDPYSPSREVANFPYDPAQGSLASMASSFDYRQGVSSQSHAHGGAMELHSQPSSSAVWSQPLGLRGSNPCFPRRHPNDMARRAFIVEHIPLDTRNGDVVSMFPVMTYPSIRGVCIRQIHRNGRFAVLFGDVRDSEAAFRALSTERPQWHMRYTTIQEVVALGLTGPFTNRLSQEDGRLEVLAFMDQRELDMTPQSDIFVHEVLVTFGSLRHFEVVSEDNASVHEYRVEYHDIQHAENAHSGLDNLLIGFVRFNVSAPGSPPSQRGKYHSSTPPPPTTPYNSSPDMKMEIVPTSPVSPLLMENGAIDHDIDLNRIRQGEDLRTTLMIRHIPNRVSAEELKRHIDQWSFGKFDFLYLRMDFMHDCNVGYAFVNFPDPMDIVTLVDNFQGTNWPGVAGSDKRVHLSYAAMQGKDALVAKFRNSTLFYVSGPSIGREAPFPGPNDPSKLRRSVVATNQQGLYTPHRRNVSGASRNSDQRGNLATPRTNRRGITNSPHVSRTINPASPVTPRPGDSPRIYRTRPPQLSTLRAGNNAPSEAGREGRARGGNAQSGRETSAARGTQAARGGPANRGSQGTRGPQVGRPPAPPNRRQNRLLARQASGGATSPAPTDANRRFNWRDRR